MNAKLYALLAIVAVAAPMNASALMVQRTCSYNVDSLTDNSAVLEGPARSEELAAELTGSTTALGLSTCGGGEIFASCPTVDCLTDDTDCLRQTQETQATFSLYDAVPFDVAVDHVAAIASVCAVADGAEAFLEEVQDDKKVCSGGGSTVIGWRDFIWVNGQHFPVVPSPASSYMTIYENRGGSYAVGDFRSTLDTVQLAAGSSVWFFGPVPMGGSAHPSVRCTGPLLTSFSLSLIGTPLGVSGSILKVEANGSTCLVPC